MRVCIDCTPINKVTEPYDWSLPRLQDLRHVIRGCSYFARLDLRDAFFRIRVKPAYRPFLTFQSQGTLWQFTRMPFGVTTAPATFQELMDHTLAAHRAYAYWYIDDILICAENQAELATRVKAVRRSLENRGHQINWEKSNTSAPSLLFAGLWVTSKGVGPNLEKAHDIASLPKPRTKAEMASALGLVSYLRDFIPLVAHFTAKLYPTQGNELSPTDEDHWWRQLKKHIAESLTTTRHWVDNAPGDLYVDASGYALGAVLIQAGQLVATASRKLTAAETRYSATDREHLALLYAAQKFRVFIHQKSGAVTVWTDHEALIGRKMAQLTPRQARWAFIVNQWIPSLRHVKGKINPADFVSRWALGAGKGGGKSIKGPSPPPGR